MKKISCKDCKRTCCDDADIKLKTGRKGINPLILKTGSWLYVKGIIWVKKKNSLWKCRAFNQKTRLCRIWKYRPAICRYYFCPFSKNKKNKEVKNMEEYKKFDELSNYELIFYSNLKELKSGKVYSNQKEWENTKKG